MKKFSLLLLGILLCFFAAGPARAAIESEHFSIEYNKGVDLKALAQQLHVSPTDEQLTNLKIDHSSAEKEIASKVEILFDRTSDALDMHLSALKAPIKILVDQDQRARPDHDSISVSAADFSRETLGHQMGNIIISHYFAVQPSPKIQEVLAGYVEYSLKKSNQ